MNELHDSLDEMKRENLRLQEEVATLKLLVAKLQQMLFGRKSERLTGEDAGQMVMADLLAEVDSINRQIAANEEELIQRKASAARKPRRNLAGMIPEDLPRVEVVHDLPEEKKVDDDGQALARIGEDRVEKLAFKPGECFVKVHVYPKYASPANPLLGVVRASAPDFAIPGGCYDESFLAMVVFEKVAMHLPLYRIE